MITTSEKIESIEKRTGRAWPTVLFVHGFLSKRLLMKPFEWQIASRGFPTDSWGYPSFIGSLDWHAKRLRPVLDRFSETNSPFHVVAHSMGSIVLRLALELGPVANLQRIVLMAPPNQGTPTARIISPLFRPFCKGVSQLSDQWSSRVHRIESCQNLEVGIIAGNFDWIVPKSRTPISGQQDHICLNSTHNSMLVMPSAARQVACFLETGRFQRRRLDSFS